jgi:hypothetical protein
MLGICPEVKIDGDRLRVTFDDFGVTSGSYALFLKVKALPEQQVEFDPDREVYTVSAPARFAPMLGVQIPRAGAHDLPLTDVLFDDQRAIVQMALDAKRFAVWSDCGSGKTLCALEFARHVIHRTGGRVLITTLNDIVPQWIDEAAKFYDDSMPLHRIKSRQEMREWCKGGGDPAVNLAVTNYEKWNPEDLDHQVVSEARHLAGVILDENRIKTGGGKQKWAIIKSCRGIEYKLSLTATPAPNDTMEFASQASFLEKMRSEGEIIWTYFRRDEKTHRWTVKKHARKAFFEFMAGWSIYVRDPKRYGWRLGQAEVPKPELFIHEIPATDGQRCKLSILTAAPDGQMQLPGMNDQDLNAIRASKLSQAAPATRLSDSLGGD